jgi:hypothetical protein
MAPDANLHRAQGCVKRNVPTADLRSVSTPTRALGRLRPSSTGYGAELVIGPRFARTRGAFAHAELATLAELLKLWPSRSPMSTTPTAAATDGLGSDSL